MWVEVLQRYRRHDLRAEAATGEMQEQNIGRYAAFVNLAKAFDNVSRNELWKVLARLACPPKFLTILRQLHEGAP